MKIGVTYKMPNAKEIEELKQEVDFINKVTSTKGLSVILDQIGASVKEAEGLRDQAEKKEKSAERKLEEIRQSIAAEKEAADASTAARILAQEESAKTQTLLQQMNQTLKILRTEQAVFETEIKAKNKELDERAQRISDMEAKTKLLNEEAAALKAKYETALEGFSKIASEVVE